MTRFICFFSLRASAHFQFSAERQAGSNARAS
jgi:hypothetical protein